MKILLKTLSVIIITGLVFGAAAAASKAAVDHSIYAELLEKYVKDGVVDYAGFKAEENRLDAYLDVLKKVDPDDLNRDEQYAFFINAYNAWTIKLILYEYPEVKSIKDIGGIFRGPWKQKIVQIDGEITTLDHIEHGILRPVFKDPRVHFAINCASKSCPPLISTPYMADGLDQQLDEVTRAFLNDPQRNRFEGNTLYVSRIFKWFKEDFNNDIIGFFVKYTAGPFKEKLKAKKDDIKIKYLEYDWSLNGK
ncbi:MAG: DUF547 domain-containing protein [Deltaproteobacteria bacterium]|nr:DUF547 domain-containing protein [Deltaproteobacteria bacterium]MBW2153119.1 DUF547 domain-containing protein [Deltaproteobacteria bacterium]